MVTALVRCPSYSAWRVTGVLGTRPVRARAVRPGPAASSVIDRLKRRPIRSDAVRSNDSSRTTVGAAATGTTAPARPEATPLAKPRPRTGNAGRPGQSASTAGDTRAWTLTVRRSAISAPGGWSGADAARSPASRTQARGGGGSMGSTSERRESRSLHARPRLRGRSDLVRYADDGVPRRHREETGM